MNRRTTYRTSIPALALLFIYLLNPFKLFLPYLDYKVNYDYIVNFLCENKDKPEIHCDGKCYLSKALKSSQDTESDHQKLATKNHIYDELTVEKITLKSNIKILEKVKVPFLKQLEITFLEHTTPPPKLG